ncbi:hypothetical protein OBBRIDRAFT_838874 [Obba rivulosa]|uniref:Uncharacterized protein n=1 Tax=Obba rivulosa TaxID=1052685 RepID=A0A8E2APE7_9APHY|nr:hypothetical protein OBBRIDRAFT_838874 [Obba rivulosa]
MASTPSPFDESQLHLLPSNGSGGELDKLRDAFGKVLANHGDIQELFCSVSAQLPSVRTGDENLSGEWDALQQEYNEIFGDAQSNASKCATYLDSFKNVLFPSAMLSPSFDATQLDEFMQAIITHEADAREVKERLQRISYDIAVFRRRILACVAKDAPNAWVKFWRDVGDFCVNIWQTICRLLELIGKAVQFLVSAFQEIKLDCVLIRLDIEMRSYSPLLLDVGGSPKDVVATVDSDCKILTEKLRGFGGAWHLVWIACSDLRTCLEQARVIVKAAAERIFPLSQCLREFATGDDNPLGGGTVWEKENDWADRYDWMIKSRWSKKVDWGSSIGSDIW